MRKKISFSGVVQFFILGVFFSLFLLSGGCAGRSDPSLAPPSETARDTAEAEDSDLDLPSDVEEELVEAPRLPDDDGIPLTPEEKAAMDSTGVLDACLTPEDVPYVELHFKFFVRKNRKTFERFLERSEPYLPYVRHAFTSRGVPEEIAYLAYVESGFNSNAVSSAGAGGMWQFMPYTGRKYGLVQDNWIDERRDPFKATHAAATYLLKLHKDFGDWLLALAAYNAGEGKISRALAGTRASGFFGLCRRNDVLEDRAQLRDETMQYVPRLLAVAKIMRNLERLGFKRPDPSKAHAVAPVVVNSGTNLKALARTSGMSWDRFITLNPAFRRTVSHPARQVTAYVPFAQESKVTAWLASKDSRIYAHWKEHRVRKGESLALIAKRHGTSVVLLREANNRSGNLIKPGETLMVPASARAGKAVVADAQVKKHAGGPGVKAPKGGYRDVHVVQAGETLYALSHQWGTSVDAVRSLNGLSGTDFLRAGQKLYVPEEKSRPVTVAKNDRGQTQKKRRGGVAQEAKTVVLQAKAPHNSKSEVVVKAGDTLYSLAKANACSVDDLCSLNNIKPGSPLRVGQKLRLS